MNNRMAQWLGMVLGLALAGATAAAGGDIHRCPDGSGSIRYQDQPCDEGGGDVLRSAPDGEGPSDAEIRRWLDERHEPAASATPGRRSPPIRAPASGVVVQVPQVTLVPRPDSPTLLASCSALFFDCTNGADAYTDRCIAELPACTGRARYGCCHAAFIDRYRSLRAAGARRQTAVRAALLGAPHEANR